MASLPSRRLIAIVAAGVVLLDQATKAMLIARVPLHTRVPLIDGLLSFTHVHNRGMAFGLFNTNASPWLRWILAAVAVAAVLIIWAYARHEAHSTPVMVAFGAVLGGALGNLVDRVRWGYVEDFVLAHWGRHEWPAFNVADAAITMGGLTLFVVLARKGDDPQVDSSPDDPNAVAEPPSGPATATDA